MLGSQLSRIEATAKYLDRNRGQPRLLAERTIQLLARSREFLLRIVERPHRKDGDRHVRQLVAMPRQEPAGILV